MKTYHEVLQYLLKRNQSQKTEYRLDRCLSLYQALGNPQHTYPTVHIAGTNGKGSTAFKTAKAFELSGYQVGLYTSPHISCYRERIQINSSLISEEEIVDLVNEVDAKARKIQMEPSFFELTTAIAFLYFARKNINIAVIETGLGGRLDATNALKPLLTVITSISLEHTQILGDSVELIAKEKAGILHPGIPVVIGHSVPLSSIPKDSPMIPVLDETPKAIAEASLNFLSQKIPISEQAIETSLPMDPPCRFEFIQKQAKTTILDVAHNPASISYLILRMQKTFPRQPFDAILSLSKTKDITSCLKQIPIKCSLTVTQSDNDRSLSASELYEQAKKIGFYDLSMCPSPEKAMVQSKNHLTLVFGSFFIMRQIRSYLGIKELRDPIDMNERMNQTPDKE